MKIVVLAGGISTEREISIVSGTQVCKALRSRGHQAILVDVYFGREDADPMQAFTDEYDVDAAAAYARSFDSQVEKSIQEGKAFFGTNVIALCQAADVVFLALHGEKEKTENFRLLLTCSVSVIREVVIWEVRLPWIRDFPNSFSGRMKFRHRQDLS